MKLTETACFWRGYKFEIRRAALSALAFAAAMGASAADLSYTPQGSAPYYWADAAAWGGTLPGSSDSVTVSTSALLSNPLVLSSGTSATINDGLIENAIFYVEPGGSLTATADRGLRLGRTLNSTTVVTNYGVITTKTLDMSTYTDASPAGKSVRLLASTISER